MAATMTQLQAARTVVPCKRQEAIVASGPPLDYSFKELRSCSEIAEEEPRSGLKTSSSRAELGESDGSASPEPGATKQVTSLVPKLRCVVRNVTNSVKLNNNMLETIQGLPQALETTLPNPLLNLQWIDLAFNQLVTIEPELLRFMNLKALYLHGNCIRSLPSAERLRKLPKLLSLTLNGNPIETSKIYRTYVIGALPTLRSLDHSTITEDEQRNSAAWFKGHIQRLQKKREEQQFASLDE